MEFLSDDTKDKLPTSALITFVVTLFFCQPLDVFTLFFINNFFYLKHFAKVTATDAQIVFHKQKDVFVLFY